LALGFPLAAFFCIYLQLTAYRLQPVFAFGFRLCSFRLRLVAFFRAKIKRARPDYREQTPEGAKIDYPLLLIKKRHPILNCTLLSVKIPALN
jgi:hypothetical protein